MLITPEFIPHQYFHKGIWLLSEKDPAWYYFIEKENRNRIINPSFIKSVDPPLREIVQFLHDKGVATTPSCSGHELHPSSFLHIYDSLEYDQFQIRKKGLMLTDIESGKKFFFKDPMYELPWTKRGFLLQALDYQRNGILGLRLNQRHDMMTELYRVNIPKMQMTVKDGIFFISMLPHLHLSFEERWNIFTREAKYIFRKHW